MVKLTQLIPVLAAAALGVASWSLGTAAPAQAESLLDKCVGSSKAVVEKCCTAWVKTNGKPLWMKEANLTCGSSVACSSKPHLKLAMETVAYIPAMVAKKPYCYLEVPMPNGNGPTPPVLRPLNRG